MKPPAFDPTKISLHRFVWAGSSSTCAAVSPDGSSQWCGRRSGDPIHGTIRVGPTPQAPAGPGLHRFRWARHSPGACGVLLGDDPMYFCGKDSGDPVHSATGW